MPPFLPMSLEDLQERGISQLDFIIISGDAYIDHPSFGAALIGRYLEANGFSVGIIAQPRWDSTKDLTRLGRPRLAFLITAGNIDSMVNHYTVNKRKRRQDLYSPGGKAGQRPDRASLVYSHRAREAYKDVPLILGGLEASLRRLAHYDYWDDRIRRSVLLDAKADLLVYGMGERPILEIAQALDSGLLVDQLTYIKGTVFVSKSLHGVYDPIMLPSYTEITRSKTSFARSFWLQYQNTDHITAQPVVEDYGDLAVVANPPAEPLSSDQLDMVYRLPFTRKYHPRYKATGGVPALKEVEFSISSSRGCFGGCSFCALTFHQGRVVQARSKQSIVAEAKSLVKNKGFKGYIHDLGGPTANFFQTACTKQDKHGVCTHRQCLFPKPCNQLIVSHDRYLSVLQELRRIPGVKKVFIRSGIRYDYLVYDKDSRFFQELCEHHISGQLKVAPEHIDPKVLSYMGKPSRPVYERFVQRYQAVNRKLGKKQYLIPYYISSHPGSDLASAVKLAEYIKESENVPEQAQDFYPTPGTLATCMYYTGIDPRTMKPVYVAKDPKEKAMQRALIHFNKPENYSLVYQALVKAKRTDLIGHDAKCLIRPKSTKKRKGAK